LPAAARPDAAGDEGPRRALAAAASGGRNHAGGGGAGGKQDTRRYTKRQVTWFRHQMPGWTWLSPEAVPDFVERELAG
jgi:hypothetical protein